MARVVGVEQFSQPARDDVVMVLMVELEPEAVVVELRVEKGEQRVVVAAVDVMRV